MFGVRGIGIAPTGVLVHAALDLGDDGAFHVRVGFEGPLDGEVDDGPDFLLEGRVSGVGPRMTR